MKKWIALVAVALVVAANAFAADTPKGAAADQKAMMEKMMKAAAPGPQLRLHPRQPIRESCLRAQPTDASPRPLG